KNGFFYSVLLALSLSPFRGWGSRKLKELLSDQDIHRLTTLHAKSRDNLREFPFWGRVMIINQNYLPLFSLNESAYLIWKHLDGRTSLEQLTGIMQSHYEVESSQAHQDILVLLGTLWKKNLITLA
ncbi:MAG: PqqD family protein, partial [Candidatus Delongbacteria bacterium]|nr:PqqD family protein [Candidatus Delongbacteria bacterium]